MNLFGGYFMIWTIVSGLIVGILLGFVMQRTRFCLTGGFRDMYVQKIIICFMPY